MDSLSQLLGQDLAVGLLRRALATNRVHHAYLFEGPDGVGKFAAALGFAQALLCERREVGVDRACGLCSACERSVLRPGEKRPRHPDVAVLARGLYDPQEIGRKTAEGQELSVDQVRNLVLSRAAYAPHEGRARVFVVRSAEELSLSAANALLKTLEEPHDRTHFVLVTATPTALLPTLRSRTLALRFGALGEGVVAELLQARGVAPEQALRDAALAQGSMQTALSLSNGEQLAARESFCASIEATLDGGSAAAVLAISETVKGARAELDANLLALAQRCVERARALAGEAPDEAERWARRHAAVQQAYRSLDSNANPQLVVESLVFGLRRL